MARRYPAQIGNWKISPEPYDLDELYVILKHEIQESMGDIKNPSMLLSGGVDSSILALLLKEIKPGITCFTIGSSCEHPDVFSAIKLAKEKDLNIKIWIPDKRNISVARELIKDKFPGDSSVYLALKFVSCFSQFLLATDGIDELMGGYWWHSHRNTEFPKIDIAFEYFWNRLEEKHLSPMYESAKKVGVNIDWIFLHEPIVNYISKIPLKNRVGKDDSKKLWKKFAAMIGVPEWVINREKRGFCDAFN